MRSMSPGARAALLLGGGAAFSPLSLSPFAWYDPSDLSTLFEEEDGTGAVSADGTAVGYMADKSGNGHHLVQATAANRPLYKTSGGLHWLEFDGTNDVLVADFDAIVQPIDYLLAFYLVTTAAFRYLVDVSNTGANQCALITDAEGDDIAIHAGSQVTNGDIAVETDYVATTHFAGASSRLALDNESYATGDAGGDGGDGLTLFSRGDGAQPANARCHGLILVNRALTDAEIASSRTYLAAKQGRVL